jgi:hypothetical protein
MTQVPCPQRSSNDGIVLVADAMHTPLVAQKVEPGSLVSSVLCNTLFKVFRQRLHDFTFGLGPVLRPRGWSCISVTARR